jgi:hypothetical protein
VDTPELLRHLSRPVDERELFDYTLGIVVRAVVQP